jgi:hypothetical protein
MLRPSISAAALVIADTFQYRFQRTSVRASGPVTVTITVTP